MTERKTNPDATNRPAGEKTGAALGARWLGLTAAFLMTLLVLGFLNIRAIYQAALFKWLGDQATIGLNKSDPHAIFKALFDYTNSQIDRRMMPGLAKAPIEYLAYGYALCDQEALLLDSLLYHQNVEARVVPLYYPDGTSDHTLLEWFDGREWLLSDPHFDQELGLTARAFVSLPRQEVISRYPKVTGQVYDYYQKHYFKEISHTYSVESHPTWFHLVRDRSIGQQLLDYIAIMPLATFQVAYLDLLDEMYHLRYHNDDQLEDAYLIARGHELLGHCGEAMDIYTSLLREDIPPGWPHYTAFSINSEMLKQRVEGNQKYCRNQGIQHGPESNRQNWMNVLPHR